MKPKTTLCKFIAISLFFTTTTLFSCEDCMKQYIYPKWIEIDEYTSAKLRDGFLLVDTNAGVMKYTILEYDAENNRYLVDLVKQEEPDELPSPYEPS